jgi:imidazolonepropionase-like amidohydrolase
MNKALSTQAEIRKLYISKIIAAQTAAQRKQERTRGETIMQAALIILCILIILGVSTPAQRMSAQTPAQSQRIVIAASTVLDGKGRVLHNTRIVIEGGKIVAIDPKAGPVDYDLRGLTVLPGWIDAHVHITWSFGKDGKNAGAGGTSQEAAYQAASNAWVTLMAGFTTVQSLGSPTDVPLRDAIAQGALPGPRILTAIEPLLGQGERTGTPDEIRATVRKQKAAGADLIKIFASGSMRQGGMTLSQEQLNAACDEAKKQGLRTLVHAYRDAVRAATLAGCTQIEHGLGASDDDLKLMAEKGIYFDPQAGLLIETYLLNKHKYAGTPYYPKTAEEFAVMEKILPMNHELLQRAVKTRELKIVFGTDAVAGAHGRNAEEFIDRVRDGGVDPMAAMISANSLGAEALGLADQIGLIAPGMQADIIALDGDPLTDITAVRRVVFVMKSGIVYKHAARGAMQ